MGQDRKWRESATCYLNTHLLSGVRELANRGGVRRPQVMRKIITTYLARCPWGTVSRDVQRGMGALKQCYPSLFETFHGEVVRINLDVLERVIEKSKTHDVPRSKIISWCVIQYLLAHLPPLTEQEAAIDDILI